MPLIDYELPHARPDHELVTTERQLLQSIVESARRIFGSAASSIFLIDADSGDLIFEAVAGEGQAHLPGTRFSVGTGIVGWVARSGEPMIADDLASSQVFDRSAAESTGYIPASIMAAPLIRDGQCIGVLEVLDRNEEERRELVDLDILALLSAQAAICLDLLVRARQWKAGESVDYGHLALLNSIVDRAKSADPVVVAQAMNLLRAADDLLAARLTSAAPPHIDLQ